MVTDKRSSASWQQYWQSDNVVKSKITARRNYIGENRRDTPIQFLGTLNSYFHALQRLYFQQKLTQICCMSGVSLGWKTVLAPKCSKWFSLTGPRLFRRYLHNWYEIKFPARRHVWFMVICGITALPQILKWSLQRTISQYNCKILSQIGTRSMNTYVNSRAKTVFQPHFWW